MRRLSYDGFNSLLAVATKQFRREVSSDESQCFLFSKMNSNQIYCTGQVLDLLKAEIKLAGKGNPFLLEESQTNLALKLIRTLSLPELKYAQNSFRGD